MHLLEKEKMKKEKNMKTVRTVIIVIAAIVAAAAYTFASYEAVRFAKEKVAEIKRRRCTEPEDGEENGALESGPADRLSDCRS